MNAIKNYRPTWAFMMAGLIAGLLLSAGMGWMQTSQAEPSPAGPPPQPVQTPALEAAQQLSDAFAQVAEAVKPSVVTVFTEKEIVARHPNIQGMPFEQFFGEQFRGFFNGPRNSMPQKQRGLGSGVVVRADGIILTNNHVIEGADEIKVRLADGQEMVASLEGRDPKTDLAVLKVEASGLTAISLGNSDAARVGEWVMAVGSPLNANLASTVTSGIISAKGRNGVGLSRYEDYIQTDAAINPGNSGGALVNLRGELIGVNTAIATRTGGNMGIGFAIPAKVAEKIMSDILRDGKVTRGWLGIYIQDLNANIAEALEVPAQEGVIVSQIQEGSPAEKARLKAEDVIIKLNGESVRSSAELSNRIAAMRPGSEAKLDLYRDGSSKIISVKLGELPDDEMAENAQGPGKRARLGLGLTDLTPQMAERFDLDSDQKGVLVTRVQPGSPAAEAGVQAGDLIVRINRKDVQSAGAAKDMMANSDPEKPILLQIRRGNGSLFVVIEE